MDPPLRETMLQRGEVDAITGFTFTSYIGLTARGVKEEDIVMMKFNDFGAELYGNSVIVSPKFAAEQPEAVKGFLRAINRAIKDVVAKPAAHIGLVKQRDPLITEAAALQRLKMAIEFVDTPVARSDGLGGINKLRFDNTIERVVAAFGIKQQVSPDGIFNSSFCRLRVTVNCEPAPKPPAEVMQKKRTPGSAFFYACSTHAFRWHCLLRQLRLCHRPRQFDIGLGA